MSEQLLLRVRCVVTKLVTVEGCTEEEAVADPWGYAVDEQEIDQYDFEVMSVEEAP